ncbi:polysaccharide biosynthesis C-terminal domain-containing protein [soil metagenome]
MKSEDSQPGDLFDETAGDLRSLAKGGALQIAGQFTSRGLAFVFIAVVSRLLGPAGYGQYRQVAQILNIGGMIAPGGFNYGAVRFITKARAQKDHPGVRGAAHVAMAGALAVSLLEFGIILVAAEPLARAFGDSQTGIDEIGDLLRLGAAFVPFFALMQVLRYCTLAYKTMVPSVISNNIVLPVSRFVIGATAVILGFGLAGAVVGLVASAILGMLVAAWFYRRMLTLAERKAKPRHAVGPMIRFAIPQAGVGIFSVQSLGLGIIILGILGTDRDVGLFGIALSLQGAGTVFLTGIVAIWAPIVTDLYERNELAQLESLYRTVNRWIATFSFPIFAALILEPDFFVGVLAGSRAVDAASLVAILAVGNLIFVGTGPSSLLLSMTGRPGINFANSIVAVAAYVVLGLLLVPAYGAIGIALVDALVTGAVNIVRVIQGKLLIGIHPFGRSFMKPVVATGAASAVVLLLGFAFGEQPALEAFAMAAGGLVYLVVLWRMGIDAEERHVYERIKKRILRRSP